MPSPPLSLQPPTLEALCVTAAAAAAKKTTNNNNNNNNNSNNLVTVENIDNKNYLEYWLPGY